MRRRIGCVTLVLAFGLVLTRAQKARAAPADGCDETIEGAGVTAVLIADVAVASFEGADAFRITRVGLYELADGTRVRIACEAWIVVVSGTQLYLVPART